MSRDEYQWFPDAEGVIQEVALEKLREVFAEIVGLADAERIAIRILSSERDGLDLEIKGPARLARKIADALSG
jgi:hypothetical protein